MLTQQSIETQIAQNQQADMNRKHAQLTDKVKSIDEKLNTLIVKIEEVLAIKETNPDTGETKPVPVKKTK